MSENKPPVDNMAIWDSVKETPPSRTKTSTFGGREVTTINTQHAFLAATKQFGPIGLGWGYDIEEDRFDDGAPLVHKGEIICNGVNHTLKIKLWYMHEGKQCFVTNYGHTKYVYATSYGISCDEEAAKKSLSDAIKKCLSMIGFFADIFLGQYEDAQYREDAQVKEGFESSENRAEAEEDAKNDLINWIDSQCKTYGKISSPAPLKLAHKRVLDTAFGRCQLLNVNYDKVSAKLQAAFQKQLDKIKPPVEVACDSCGEITTSQPNTPCGGCGNGKLKPTK